MVQTRIRLHCAASMFLWAFSACTPKEPHLGTTVTTASIDGLRVEQRDSRSILPSGGLAGEESVSYEIQATVEGIEPAARILLLKLPNGESLSFFVSERIKNFTQIQPGDVIKVACNRNVQFELREPTAEEMARSNTEVGASRRARLGELPNSIVATAELVIVTVDSVSTERKEINVRTSDGSIVTFAAKYPENLPLVKVGQKAVISYGQTVVAGVTRAQ